MKLSHSIKISPISASECKQVVQLHRSAFSHGQRKYTIFESAGVESYLSSLVRFADLRDDHQLVAAWDGNRLVGYSHFRALPDSWHLNYIVVTSAYQGQGIGGILWRHWIDVGRQRGYTKLSLDVDQENNDVIAWYRRQGLRITETTWTYEKSLKPASAAVEEIAAVRLLDWEQAEASQHTYGFSQFRLHYRGNIWTIGQLGQDYFRVTQQLPEALESVLAKMDPHRRMLLVSSQVVEGNPSRLVAVHFRMQGQVS